MRAHSALVILFAVGNAAAALPSETKLGFKEAISLALSNHPGVQSARLESEAAALRIDQAYAPFESALELRLQGSFERKPLSEAGNGVAEGPQADGFLALRRTFQFGTSVGLEARHTLFTEPSPYRILSPQHDNSLRLLVEQPLLRGFGTRANTALIVEAKAMDRAARLDFMRVIEVRAAQAATTYWGLWLAQRDVEIHKSSVERAAQLVSITRQQVKAGSQTETAIAQAQATAALRDAQLWTSQRTLQDAQQLAATALLLSKPSLNLWAAESPPDPGPLEKTANRKRADVEAAAERLAAAKAAAIRAEDQARAQLNVGLFAGLRGLGGVPNPAACSLLPPGEAAGCAVDGPFSSNFGSSLGTLTSGNYYYVGGSVSLALPIENGSNRAQAEIARLGARRSGSDAEERVRVARLEVEALWRAAAAERQNFESSQRAHQLAVKLLDIEEKKYRFGASTTFDLLRVQSDLAEAQLLEARARANAAITDIQLALAQGRVLDSLSIRLDGLSPE